MTVNPESIKIKVKPTPHIVIRDFTLDKVIREFPADQLPQTRNDIKNTSHKIIIYDPDAGEVVRRARLLIFKRHYKYYLISTRDEAHGETEYDITSLELPLPPTIKVSYNVRCELGKEETLVKSLSSENSVTDTLNLMIKRFIQVFIADLRKSGIKPEVEFAGYKDRLTGDLKRYLSNQVGLQTDIVLSIKGDDMLKDLAINLDPFSVRVMDYNEPLSLQVEAELNIDASNRSAAIPYISRQDNLKEFIISQIKRYLSENVTLHQFVYRLQTAVKSELMEMLERALITKGRKIAWLQLKSNVNFEIPKRNADFHYSVLCDISDYSRKIEVEHKLLLQLDDLGLFKTNSGGLSLEEWVEDRLNAITKDEMFTQRYVDILMDFDQDDPEKQEILNRIKQKMQRQVNRIGHTVKHLIVQPNMKPILIKKNGFMLNLKEEEFATHISRVNVNLDIVVTGKIHDLRKLHAYIAPDKDIEKEMERVVRLEIEKQMHDVDPQEYYMPFKGSDGKTAEEKLKIEITRVMQEQFYAHDIKIVLKTRETGLIERILKLVNGSPYHIKVDVLPLAGGGTQEYISFEIEFLIQAVNQWNTFIYKNFTANTETEINKIKEALQKDIKSKLMTVPYDVLKYSDIRGANVVREVARTSHPKISAVFGLEINITNVTRSRTMIEVARQKILAVKVAKQISKEKTIIEEEVNSQEEIFRAMQKNMKNILINTPELAHQEEFNFARDMADDIKKEGLLTGVEEASRKQLAVPESKNEWSLADYTDEFRSPFSDTPDDENGKKSIKGETCDS